MKKLLLLLLTLFILSGCYARKHGRTRWTNNNLKGTEKCISPETTDISK